MPKKHLFMDMDGSITESRQEISKEMFNLLSEMKLNYDIIVISGAEKERMKTQLKDLDVEIMAQSGNDARYWKNLLTKSEKKQIYNHIKKYGNIVDCMIDDRGCQVSVSFTGHKAPTEIKNAYDPDNTVRKKLLQKNPFLNKTLECRIAGSTCIDYTKKSGTKGKNIQRLIKLLKWDKKDCVYFGDKLFKGGNDESVVGIVTVVEVVNPSDLFNKLKNYA
jgi:hypothetical protein